MNAYSFLLETFVLQIHNFVRRRHYVEYRRFLEKSQWWSPEELNVFEWREAMSLLRHALQCVPYYQAKYGRAGARLEDIRTWDDWRRLPVLTRAEINEHRSELCARNHPERISPHATGGSSGVPTRFYITDRSYDWRSAAAQRVYSWSGCLLGERTAYLWGAPVGKLPRWKLLKVRTHERIQRQLVINTMSQDEASWLRIFHRIKTFRPLLLVGYVSSLVEFARFLKQTGRALPGIRAVIAAAEPLFQPVRLLLEEAIGAPVFNTYGSREFMSIGGECDRHDGMHVNCENILLETASPDAVEPSEFLVTDLHNYGMPFIRYQIGDVGTIDRSSCPCGRGLPRIKAIEGRILDMIRTSTGRVVPGEFFPHVLKDVPEIREYQVHQKTLDQIVISAVLREPLSPASRSLLEGEIRKVFEAEVRVEVEPVAAIPRLPSGKHRVTVGLG